MLVVMKRTASEDEIQADVRHVFLHGARTLRPAWAVDLPGDTPLGVP